MHNSSCPKCGASFAGDSKTCGSCGAVSSFPFRTACPNRIPSLTISDTNDDVYKDLPQLDNITTKT
ncbi:hypothetical protein F4860DRAFT_496195 [Xylaria cubensis]|nr:hypothetical protein F4860DRAFT_496195 [Xylaria cubensis]